MSKTLQIVELMLTEMEKEPNRYRLEITLKGICIVDYKEYLKTERETLEMNRVLPDYYTFFHEPTENYQHECNKMFEEFIGGLKA